MNKSDKRFINFILFLTIISASLLIGAAAFFSVSGLSETFAGAATSVLIMGGALEFAKVVISIYVHNFWNKFKGVLKWWLAFSLIILILITSLGIYGFLSNAFKETEAQFNASNRRIELIDFKKENFNKRIEQTQSQVDQYNTQLSTLMTNRSSMAAAVNNSSDYYEKIDSETGEKIRVPITSNRRVLLNQIETIDGQISNLQNFINDKYKDIETQRDSILALDERILEEQMTNEASAELGPLIYVSEITGKPISTVVNWFMLILVIVFDPLAVSLVFAASAAYEYLKKKGEREAENKPEPIAEPEEDLEPDEDNSEIEYHIEDAQAIRDFYKRELLKQYMNTPEGREKGRKRKKKEKVEELNVEENPTEDPVIEDKIEESKQELKPNQLKPVIKKKP